VGDASVGAGNAGYEAEFLAEVEGKRDIADLQVPAPSPIILSRRALLLPSLTHVWPVRNPHRAPSPSPSPYYVPCRGRDSDARTTL
jgi:hypothetical protein